MKCARDRVASFDGRPAVILTSARERSIKVAKPHEAAVQRPGPVAPPSPTLPVLIAESARVAVFR
jgi:hypothetical protein